MNVAFGSILAPNANVDLPRGTSMGDVIAKSATDILTGPIVGFATTFTCAAPGPGGG